MGRRGEKGRPRAELKARGRKPAPFKIDAHVPVFTTDDCPFVDHKGQSPYQATVDWLVDAIPNAGAQEKIYVANAHGLYFGGG